MWDLSVNETPIALNSGCPVGFVSVEEVYLLELYPGGPNNL